MLLCCVTLPAKNPNCLLDDCQVKSIVDGGSHPSPSNRPQFHLGKQSKGAIITTLDLIL